MTIYAAASTRGFYDSAIHGNAIPGDAVEITSAQHLFLINGQAAGKQIDWSAADGIPVLVDPPAPTFDQQVDTNKAALQSEMDRVAKLRGYDNIDSACKYASLPAGAPYQAEGAAYLLWCATVWHQAFAYLTDVQAGLKPMPTAQQAVAMMPPLVLPA